MFNVRSYIYYPLVIFLLSQCSLYDAFKNRNRNSFNQLQVPLKELSASIPDIDNTFDVNSIFDSGDMNDQDFLLHSDNENYKGLNLLVYNNNGEESNDDEGNHVVYLTMEELQSRWVDYCIESNRPQDVNAFHIGVASILAKREDAHVVIIDSNASNVDVNDAASSSSSSSSRNTEDVIYVTEQELRNNWSAERKFYHEEHFDIKSAFLLFSDDDDAKIMQAPSEVNYDDNDGQSSISLSSPASSSSSSSVVLEDEVYVSIEELKAVWDDRSRVTFGMPCESFDVESALLLLEEEDDGVLHPHNSNTKDIELNEDIDDSGEIEVSDEDVSFQYVPCYEYIDTQTLVSSINNANATSRAYDLIIDQGVDYWNEKYKGNGPGQQFLRENFKALYDDLENFEYLRPAWKKSRHILTPDIDTQKFEGDIMNSNTYMTPRVPANWDDPEKNEMSETYLTTGSMSWDGEEETDYSVIQDVWDTLQLPIVTIDEDGQVVYINPKLNNAHSIEGNNDGDEGERIGDEGVVPSLPQPIPSAINPTLNPRYFQFNNNNLFGQNSDDNGETSTFSSRSGSSSGASGTDVEMKSNNDDSIDIGLGVDTTAEAEPLSSDVDMDSFFEQIQESEADADDKNQGQNVGPESTLDVDFEREAVEMVAGKAYESLKPKVLKWITPIEWLEKDELSNHVDFNTWSNYDNTEFIDMDDDFQDDDIRTILSYRHILGVTDEYLEDHLLSHHITEDRRNAERHLKLSSSWLLDNNNNIDDEIEKLNRIKVPIPYYLTPDADAGVTYSDEIIEMKGKMTLHVNISQSSELYGDNSFDHAEDQEALNKVGTVREQYDWEPTMENLIKPVNDGDNYNSEFSGRSHYIDEHIEAQIQPVIQLINHAGILKSTQDDVIIFEYKGNMRHIVGIRDMMLSEAKKCYPPLKDLRLETWRKSDKFDT